MPPIRNWNAPPIHIQIGENTQYQGKFSLPANCSHCKNIVNITGTNIAYLKNNLISSPSVLFIAINLSFKCEIYEGCSDVTFHQFTSFLSPLFCIVDS